MNEQGQGRMQVKEIDIYALNYKKQRPDQKLSYI